MTDEDAMSFAILSFLSFLGVAATAVYVVIASIPL